MPQITLLNTTGTKWGTSSYSNGNSPFTLGRTADYTCRGRVGWGPLDPTWQITSIKLYMNRTDGYAGKTLKIGSSVDTAWGATLDWSQNIYASTGTGVKSWDLTAYKTILQAYTCTWYLHFNHGSGDSSYCEWTAGSGSSAPRLVVEYEEATLSVPGGAFTIGVQSTITVGTLNSGLTHKLSYSIGTASGTFAGGGFITAGSAVTWTPDATLASQITTDMTGDVTLTLATYSGGVLQSTRALTYPLNVPASYVPSISSAPFVLQNPAGDTIGVYVQNRSWTKCTVTASSVYGATITEYRLTIGGVTKSSATNVITTDPLTMAGVLSATVTVIDSRGQTATLTNASAVTVYEYFAPIVTSFSLLRCDSGGVASNVGTYMKYVLTVVFAPVNNLNTRGGSIKFKVAGGSYGTAVALSTITSYSTTVTGVIGAGAIGSSGYVAAVGLTDRYSNGSALVEASLAPSKLWFDLHSSGEGMAIGKPSTEASKFDSGLPAIFRKDVTFETLSPAAPPMLGFGGVQLAAHIDSTKMATVTTHYICYYDVVANTPTLFAPWKISGQTYYNGVQVLVAGWYLFNGRAAFGGVTAIGHGRFSVVAMDASNAALLTSTLTGSANSLPSAILAAAIDAYSATSDYETSASLMCKASKVLYLPANAIVVAYLNAQTANLTRGDEGFFELCRVG